MPYHRDGQLKTDKREVAISETWDTQTDWTAYQSATEIDVSNGVVRLAQVTYPTNGLHQHYDAIELSLSDGAVVDPWPDASSNSYALSNGDPLYQTNIQNGNPGVEFTPASSDVLTTGTFSTTLTQPFEIFTVAMPRAASSRYNIHVGNSPTSGQTGGLLYITSGGDWAIFSGSSLSDGPADTNAHVFSQAYDGASSALYVDGSSVATGDAGTRGLTNFRVGDGIANSNPFDGYLFEIMVYNRSLTSSERNDVESYLGDKWGVTIS